MCFAPLTTRLMRSLIIYIGLKSEKSNLPNKEPDEDLICRDFLACFNRGKNVDSVFLKPIDLLKVPEINLFYKF